MNSAWLDAVAVWLALALGVGVLTAALAAATARSLFSMCMHLAAAGALGAATLAALGAGDLGLGQALLLAGLAPVILLASMLLSTRAAKPRREGWPWLTIAAACAAAGAMLWASLELGTAALTHAPTGEPAVAAWLAPLVFVAVVSAVGLLGFAERGALQRPAAGDET